MAPYLQRIPGRAAILIKLLGLDKNQIKCVYEQNKSIKFGIIMFQEQEFQYYLIKN